MDTRRDFLKKAMMLSGAAAASGFLPDSIARALAINPDPKSTYLDAEHVVILMQENRSFDHCFGTLQGVRGFNDPRRVDLANGNPVWLQTNSEGKTYAPFWFDIHGTKSTWMGTTPHSRTDQVQAYNDGKYDRWLDVKKVKGYPDIPMTLGYYTRKDVPFNYALADAFTVCDQNFCSAMTSTWPNRLFLWSGTIRATQDGDAKAYVRNVIPYGEANWLTYPEMLEQQGVSWKVYQNELEAGGGFQGEERAWLGNFGCNLLEWFTQFNVRFSTRYVEGLKKQLSEVSKAVEDIKHQLDNPELQPAQRKKLESSLLAKEKVLAEATEEAKKWSKENFEKLTPEQKNLFHRAFTINQGDPNYHSLESFSYEVNGEKREFQVPKGDVFHQFRKDVNEGKLPTVSWLVGPAKFSDHPTAPWFGSWYVSEVLDILTKNPEVWKKTIFILTYDENDGYFDHIPPYVAPDPRRPETGRCSEGIDPAVEYITLENELRDGVDKKQAIAGPIGLGYRVPMIIASPWSRGGRVCSHIFDHTSIYRFVQDFLNKKKGTKIKEFNVSEWRKTVTGDISLVFRPYEGDGRENVMSLNQKEFLKGIYNAKFKEAPTNFKALDEAEIQLCKELPDESLWMPKQEPGVRPSCALPYQLYADGKLNEDRSAFVLKLEASNEIFGSKASGSPFNVFIPVKQAVMKESDKTLHYEHLGYRSYAVKAGAELVEVFPLNQFEDGRYHVCVHGPNGFFREHKGHRRQSAIEVRCEYDRDAETPKKLNGKLKFSFNLKDTSKRLKVLIRDHSYGKPDQIKILAGARETVLVLDQSDSHGWYDYSVTVEGERDLMCRFAGRIETGRDGYTDPLMGRVV